MVGLKTRVSIMKAGHPLSSRPNTGMLAAGTTLSTLRSGFNSHVFKHIFMKHYSLFTTVVVILMAGLSSCLKKDFDSPPDTTGFDPHLPVNMTIGELKEKFNAVQDA